MMRIFSTMNGHIEQLSHPERGSWVNLTAPTDSELAEISEKCHIELADLRASLDDEERSRVDVEDNYTMIIVDIPTVEERGDRDWFETIPLSIIVTDELIVTVCMEDSQLLHPFMDGAIRGFNTFMRSRFILQILYRNASMYLRYLRVIDRQTDKLEVRLENSTENSEILMLMELSKSLVYFTTSLKSNEVVLEKLTNLQRFRYYEDDADLLEDVITENKQAIEMATIYQSVLSGLMEAFGAIVSNNVNYVMKIFTIISIVIAIPDVIFSMYGMNFAAETIPMPFGDHPFGFYIIVSLAFALATVAGWVFTKSKWFK